MILAMMAPALAVDLPFPDGTYVTDPALCALSPQERVAQHGDMVGAMVLNVKGEAIDNGYESFCRVTRVRESSNDIRADLACSSEGEQFPVAWQLTRHDQTSFTIAGRTYRRCS
ncbi:MAG: hypothetical protein AAFX39_14295 [Pseudomonadota bacterium]